MNTFENYFYKNVYVIGYDSNEAETGKRESLQIIDDSTEIIAHLRSRDAITDYDIKVLLGWLTPATVLPKNLRGKIPYILVQSPNISYGFIIESCAESGKELSKEVEKILDIADIYINDDVGIENIYILYGQELNVTLSLDEDYFDEEVISSCEKIVDEVKQITEENIT